MQHTLLVLVLLSLAKTQTLTQKYEKNKLIVGISSEENEILIDFQNQDNLFFDQLFCKVQECKCFFTKENINSSILKEPECENQKLILERSVPNLKANLNVTRKRIMAEAYTDADMTDSKVIDSRLTLKWKFNSDNTIEFATIWNKKTWLGIGFGSTMRNVDMITINVVGTNVELIDLYSTSTRTPPTDAQQDYTLVSFEVGSASVKTRFKRKLSTGDSKDKTLTSGSSYNWCYAYSSGLAMEMHTVNLGFSITLTNTAPSSSSGTGSSTSGTSGTGTSTSGTGTSTSGTGTSTSGTGTSTSGTGTSTSGSGSTSSSSGTGSSSSGTETTSSSSSEDSESESDSEKQDSENDSDSESTSTTSSTTYSYKSTSYGTISLALLSLAIYLL